MRIIFSPRVKTNHERLVFDENREELVGESSNGRVEVFVPMMLSCVGEWWK